MAYFSLSSIILFLLLFAKPNNVCNKISRVLQCNMKVNTLHYNNIREELVHVFLNTPKAFNMKFTSLKAMKYQNHFPHPGKIHALQTMGNQTSCLQN